MARIVSESDNKQAMKVYLASPLFTPEQNAVLDRVEAAVGGNSNFTFFSPRSGSGGNLRIVEGEERVALAQRIYDDNIEQLVDCNVVLVNIDDFDTGTMVELGYANALRDNTNQQKVIITYSPSAYGLNIMINNSGVAGHFIGLEALEAFFQTTMTKNLAELKYDLRFASMDLRDNKDVEKDAK